MLENSAPNGETHDAVNSPKHYQSPFQTLKGFYIQALDVIVAWNLSFNLGNTVKYICRSGKKDPGKYIEDLEKARYYLDLEIQLLKKSHFADHPTTRATPYHMRVEKEIR